MPDRSNHSIRQVTLEVGRSTRSGSYELQERLGTWFWKKGQQLIEEVFNELAPPEVVLQLDWLEIDLGQLAEANLETDLEPLFRRLLREALRTQLGKVGRPWSGTVQVADSPRERIFAQWLHYLEHGKAPWWGTATRSSDEYQAAVCATLAANKKTVADLNALLRRHSQVVDRLALGHQPAEQEALLRSLGGSRLAGLFALWEQLYQWYDRHRAELHPLVRHSFHSRSEWTTASRRYTWRYLAEPQNGRNATASAILAAFLRQWWPVPDRMRTIWSPAGWAETVPSALTPVLVTWGASYSPAVAQEIRRALGITPPDANEAPAGTEPRQSEDTKSPPSSQKEDPSLQPSTEDATPDKGRADRVVPSDSLSDSEEDPAWSLATTEAQAKMDNRPPKAAKGETFYFDQAGVVMLHPFLPPLFTNLGYWKEDQFASDSAWQRAVLLTHYLATGTELPPEEELLLPKLLCGRAFELPVIQTTPFTDAEHSEANDLLQSVIRHWGAIGQASPEGLREGFFARQGKLERRSGRWELTVERKAQDLLLGKLPWGLSLIRLPWLKELIHVTW